MEAKLPEASSTVLLNPTPTPTLPAVGSIIAPTLTTGGLVSASTVRVATELVAEMGTPLAITRNWSPLSPIPKIDVARNDAVAPVMLVQVVLPFGANCHW